MSRTRPAILVLLLVVGAVAGFVVETLLVVTGRPRFDPPLTLPFALVLTGVLVILLALPVRRSTRAPRKGGAARRRVDPFYATRVVVLAKASALSGALLAGAGLGILAWVLTRSVVAGVGSTVMAVAAAGGAIVLLVAGLVAEHLCTVPPDDHDDGSAATA